jgi:hypothetical protein
MTPPPISHRAQVIFPFGLREPMGTAFPGGVGVEMPVHVPHPGHRSASLG